MKVIDVRDTPLWKALLPKLRTQDEEISLLLDLQSVADLLGKEFWADATNLGSAFTWSTTLQGHEFWEKRHNELASRSDVVPAVVETAQSGS